MTQGRAEGIEEPKAIVKGCLLFAFIFISVYRMAWVMDGADTPPPPHTHTIACTPMGLTL